MIKIFKAIKNAMKKTEIAPAQSIEISASSVENNDNGDDDTTIELWHPVGLVSRAVNKSQVLTLTPNNNNGWQVGIATQAYQLDIACEDGDTIVYASNGNDISANIRIQADGTIIIDAKNIAIDSENAMQIKTQNENMHALLKDMLDIINNIQTAPINTDVNGGSTSSGAVVGAKGINFGIGVSTQTKADITILKNRLDNLLQQ